jgi:hypothetical protein
MKTEFDPKLEALLNAELKKLPLVQAPPTLAANVLEKIAARARLPWWQHSWWDWPATAKAAFLLIALAIVTAISRGGVLLDQGLANYSQQVTERLSPVASVWDTTQTLINALGLLWEKAAQPFLLYGLVGLGAVYLVSLGLGTVCFRYVLKRS